MSEQKQLRNTKTPEPQEPSITIDLRSLFKKHYAVILIIAFILFGFYLRAYHIDYPPIGYHNMKENQYLPYTLFMYNADEFLDYFRTETFWAGSTERGYFTQYELPIISWLILPGWKVFGVQLWFARLIIILFSLGCIPLIYKITKELGKRKEEQHNKHLEWIALTASFLFAIMPLAIFFGRNVQPETPGLFFILLGTFFFLKWREHYLQEKPHYKLFSFFSLSILTSILLKVPNGIGVIPLLFFVPYKKLINDKITLAKLLCMFIVIIAIFPIWATWSKIIMPGSQTVGAGSFSDSFSEVLFNSKHVFSGDYFKEAKEPLKAFAKDNYTWWFVAIAILGVLFAVKELTKQKEQQLYGGITSYIFSSVIAIIIYILAFATKTKGHSYYQVLFLFFVCLAAAYAIYSLGHLLNKLTIRKGHRELRIKYAEYILLAIVLVAAYPSLKTSVNNQFNTLFIGEDVAGDFIRQNSQPNERVFMYGAGSQNVGMLWNAQRYGTHDYIDNLTKIQELEQTLNFRWFFLYRDGIPYVQQHPDVWNYIINNYKLRQIGGSVEGNNFLPLYIVLEKGGTFNADEFQQIPPVLAKTYELSYQKIDLYTVSK